MMKKIFAVTMLLFMPWSLSAQSDKPRDWNQLISLLEQSPNVQYCLNQNLAIGSISESKNMMKALKNNTFEVSSYLPVSLKTLTPEQLNDIEKNLLLEYADVAVKRDTAYQVYFTIDEEGRIGVVSSAGEELYPPIAGKVTLSLKPNIGLVGVPEDIFEKSTWWDRLVENSVNNAKYNVAFPIYRCIGAVVFSAKGAQPVIPYGEYDCCYMTRNFSGSYFYVCRYDGGTELWGVLDKSGKQLVECKYKSVEFKKGKFIGHNDMTMDDVMDIYEVQIKEKEQRAQIREMVAEIMRPVGEALLDVGIAMQQAEAGGNAASDVSSTSQSSSSKSSSSGVHPGMSQSQLQNRYNTEIQTIRKLRESWAEHLGTYGEVRNQNTLRTCKENIQSIKKSAAEHGVTLQTDPLENWNP